MHKNSDTLFIYIGSNRWVALFACLLLLTACHEKRTYSHYAAVNVEGWQRMDTVAFYIPPQHDGLHTLDLQLRATTAFPFTHLTMLMERTTYPTHHTRRDTVRCQITDRNGMLLGKSGISSTELTYHLGSMSLHEGDSMVIKLSHCMQREPLPGIMDIGIEVGR